MLTQVRALAQSLDPPIAPCGPAVRSKRACSGIRPIRIGVVLRVEHQEADLVIRCCLAASKNGQHLLGDVDLQEILVARCPDFLRHLHLRIQFDGSTFRIPSPGALNAEHRRRLERPDGGDVVNPCR